MQRSSERWNNYNSFCAAFRRWSCSLVNGLCFTKIASSGQCFFLTVVVLSRCHSICGCVWLCVFVRAHVAHSFRIPAKRFVMHIGPHGMPRTERKAEDPMLNKHKYYSISCKNHFIRCLFCPVSGFSALSIGRWGMKEMQLKSMVHDIDIKWTNKKLCIL